MCTRQAPVEGRKTGYAAIKYSIPRPVDNTSYICMPSAESKPKHLTHADRQAQRHKSGADVQEDKDGADAAAQGMSKQRSLKQNISPFACQLVKRYDGCCAGVATGDAHVSFKGTDTRTFGEYICVPFSSSMCSETQTAEVQCHVIVSGMPNVSIKPPTPALLCLR